jgi:ribosomal protein S19
MVAESLILFQRAMRHCNYFAKKRPKWKGPFVVPISNPEEIYKRSMVILPQFVGKIFKVRTAAPHHAPYPLKVLDT